MFRKEMYHRMKQTRRVYVSCAGLYGATNTLFCTSVLISCTSVLFRVDLTRLAHVLLLIYMGIGGGMCMTPGASEGERLQAEQFVVCAEPFKPYGVCPVVNPYQQEVG